MARVKVCPVRTCGTTNKPNQRRCKECGTDLTRVEIREEGEGSDVEPGSIPERKEQIPGANREELGTTVRAALEFPWGKVPVRGGLNIGRLPEFSPIADWIEENLSVSGRHAEVYLDEDGFLYVRHMSTTNPTYINGESIDPGVPIQLADGDEVGFSRNLTATVRLG